MSTQTLTPPEQLKGDAARARKQQLRAWGRLGARQSMLASLLGIAQAVFFCGFAWGSASAISALVHDQSPLPGFALALFAIAIRALLQWGESRLGFEASARIRARVRHQAAQALSDRGPQFTERHDSGALATTLIDAVEKLDRFYGRYTPLMPVVTLAPLIILAATFTQSWVVGVIFLVTAPVLIIFMAIAGAAAAHASRGQLQTLTRLAGRFNDRMQALEMLNAFNATGYERTGLAEAAEQFRKRTMRVLAMAFLSSSVLEFFSAVAIAGTAIYVGFSLLGALPFEAGETIDIKAGLFVLMLAPEFYMPLRRLSLAYHDRADAEAAYDALAPIFKAPDQPSKPLDPIVLSQPPKIEFKQAGSVYSDGRRGLRPLDFTAPPGQITALWGPSGSGKSTALKMLMGYAPISEGIIAIDDQRLLSPLLGQAAWIAQRSRIFHGTLADNITLFDDTIDAGTIRRAAEAAGVMEFAASLPDQLQSRLGDHGAGVSGGQAQRIALARALAIKTPLILLDEPTAHLDGQTEARFIKTLSEAAKGRTVLIATHSPAVRAACDHVVNLEQGE